MRLHSLLLAPVLAALLLSAPASGAENAPQPCAGMLLTDPAGDAVAGPLGGGPAPELDARGVFLNYVGGRLTVNIALEELTRDAPAALATSGGTYYSAYWVFGDRVRFVRAGIPGAGGEVQFRYGYVSSPEHGGDPVGGLHHVEGATDGLVAEGPSGIVSIAVPPEIGGAVGSTLGALGATVTTVAGADDTAGVTHLADAAPDGFDPAAPEGPGSVVQPCPSNELQRADAGPPVLPPLPAAPPPAPAAPAPVLALETPRAFRLPVLHVRARARMRALRLVLRPAGSRRALATARVRALRPGRARVRLRLRRRAVRPGRYVLDAAAVVDGRRLTVSRAVRVRR